MKREAIFKELPEKVQGFVNRLAKQDLSNYYAEGDTINLNWLHYKVDWTKATDDERMAYAWWRYPKGTKHKGAGSGDFVSNGNLEWRYGNIYDSSLTGCIYSKDRNEWAEIISEPEEKPIFKVGDRPKWTPELIKQLPHGTVLRCAYDSYDIFTYQGQEIKYDSVGDMYVFFDKTKNFFENTRRKLYAEIVSLPEIKEASLEAQQEFVKANPGMQHVEEPKAGDMVEVSDGDCFIPAFYRFFADGKHWVSDSPTSEHCQTYDKIRLPQKSEVESKAKEFSDLFSADWYEGFNEGFKVNGSHKIHKDWLVQKYLDAIKWGQTNPDKI